MQVIHAENAFSSARPRWRAETVPTDPRQTRVEKLRAVLPHLGERDRRFGGDLLAQWDEKHRLSDKQWPWIDTLAERGTAAAQAPAATPAIAQGGLEPIVAMFDKAAREIQFPTVQLLAGELELKLTRAGPQSRNPGTVSVVSRRGSYYDRTYYGRVNRDGTWAPSKDGTTHPEIYAALAELAANPAEVAVEYARRIGACCFCGTEIKTKASLRAGYGPICASNYGLPWG